MKKFIFLFIVSFSTFIFAQDKIDTVQFINNGTLNIEIDSRINTILKTKEDATCTYATPVKKNTEKKATVQSSDPCAGNPQINGFKIQIYYSKDRKDADKVRNEFMRSYPDLSAQTVYYSPDYRVLVGDYFTRASASKDIRRLKSKYNSAFSIPFKVLCRKAK
ncbi:SPOR domain-containing protein [Empedobacter tilapiae]|uniref:SPOR domain-containing protein n=1 Tax=Empedobacter tilapiae TaxID=2491114 RepID=A0A4Z1AZJ7_9FLAO|nr:SPOR domain-containing protein [Empedobacter tilapiae]TGN23056.1 SPOR domain-containing protein [Empedobacter tilapiae]